MKTKIKQLSMAMRVALLMLTTAGCSKTVYVPVENSSITHNMNRQKRLTSDTLYIHDSITTIINGDTMIREIIRDRNHIMFRCDTIEKQRTDTIFKTTVIPCTGPVGKQRFKKVKSTLFASATLIIGLCILSLSWRRFKKRNSKI